MSAKCSFFPLFSGVMCSSRSHFSFFPSYFDTSAVNHTSRDIINIQLANEKLTLCKVSLSFFVIVYKICTHCPSFLLCVVICSNMFCMCEWPNATPISIDSIFLKSLSKQLSIQIYHHFDFVLIFRGKK